MADLLARAADLDDVRPEEALGVRRVDCELDAAQLLDEARDLLRSELLGMTTSGCWRCGAVRCVVRGRERCYKGGRL